MGNPDFDQYQLSDEQRMLRQAVRELADDKIAPRAAEIDESAEFPTDVYDALVRAGFHAVHIPEEYGGVGARARLRQRIGGDPLAARHLRQEPLLLLLVPREPHREGAQLLHGEDEAHGRVGLGDLLDRDEEHQGPGRGPTVALVVREAEDLVLPQQLDHVPREVPRLVDLGRPRRDALARQSAHELANLELLA